MPRKNTCVCVSGASNNFLPTSTCFSTLLDRDPSELYFPAYAVYYNKKGKAAAARDNARTKLTLLAGVCPRRTKAFRECLNYIFSSSCGIASFQLYGRNSRMWSRSLVLLCCEDRDRTPALKPQWRGCFLSGLNRLEVTRAQSLTSKQGNVNILSFSDKSSPVTF